MMRLLTGPGRVAVAGAFLVGIGAPTQAATLLYSDFSDTSGLQLNASAASEIDAKDRAVLRVTPSAPNQAGSAFSTTAVALSSSYSFSTRFTFNFNSQANGGADGLVFVIQPNSNTAGGLGGGIGYLGIPNSVGIEFDSWYNNNGWDYTDISGNHVGVNLGGSASSVRQINSPYTLDSGQDLTAWIDYDGANKLLEVRFSDGIVRPTNALISYNVDLQQAIGNPNAYVGFTSGTGASQANHDVINWEFRDTFAPIGAVPEPGTWALLILGFGLVGSAMRRRRLVAAFV